ncbi:intermembrane phospholipid transport protein YdbH family protein [Brumicola pallidula]|uniref:Uncharacterized protein n=1 Tax=Brumicola pallidula DSM 14239 = ACAM 615 TaxID=1121922 RepID=K6ZK19_9ALTE|nr:YdbH domain-containing protein [Glaciecola pallidula]GAC30697.1 hypothetical protein GPAL_3857 [Glaciecola pallidula DSM 14239 = ACAM 615]
MTLLSGYVFRVSLAKWVIADSLPKGAQVTCLEFDLGLSPTLSINELCLNTQSVDIEIHNASWFLDNWRRKTSRLNIDKLRINHKNTDTQVGAAPVSLELPNIALPASLPRITIKSLNLQSYFLQQPLELALKQRSASNFMLSGDVNATADYIDGTLQGTINWTPSRVIEQSQLLQEKTQFLHQRLNWQALINTKIDSQFAMAGNRIETSHSLHIKPQVKLESCPISVEAKGKLLIDLTLPNFEARIDASDFPISADLAECQLIPAQLKDLKIATALLTATQPLIIKGNALLTSSVELFLPEFQLNPIVTLSAIELGFDQSLSLDYAFDLAASLADLRNDKLALNGEVAINSNGKLTKNDNNWTMVSGSAEMQVSAPATRWAIADSLTNSFNYRVSFSNTDKLDLSLSGRQHISGIKTTSQLGSIIQLSEIKTDWQMSNSAAKTWQIKLINKIPDVIFAQTKLVKLINTSDIIIKADSGLQLTGQSTLESIGYTDKKLNKLTFEHELSANLSTMKTAGKHSLQLGSGLSMQINHTEKDVKVLMAEQQIKSLHNLVNQFNSKVQLLAGTFSSELSGTFSSSNYSGTLKLTDTSLTYDDFEVLFLQLNEGFSFNSAGLQLSRGKINIEEINVGIPIRKVALIVDIVDSVAKLESAEGELIGGTFKVTNLWFDGRKQRTNISVSSLDLADIAALQKQQGIQVTGEMSGILPFQLGSENGIIQHGMLASDGPGKLKIQDNAAFDLIKNQQKELSFLQNVEYRKLSSKVELASDGWLDLELSIAGRNPEKEQEVIFNYGHKENIFTLLKSLRITGSIQDSIEKRIEKRYLEKGK